MGYGAGFDIGTTFTAAGVARRGHSEMINLGADAYAVPSVVHLRADNTMTTGRVALQWAASDPDRVVRQFKRRVGDPTPIMVGGTPYAAHALMGRMLGWTYRLVSERQGEPPEQAVVTHPANWGPYKRETLEQAITSADIEGAELLSEPEAAAIHYAAGEGMETGEIIAVYDLGGGTFDAAVLRKVSGRGFEILGEPTGVEALGGIDFDRAVFGHVQDDFADTFDQLDSEDPAVRTGLEQLQERCIAAKIALSSDTDTVVPVVLPGLTEQVRITRSEFEDRIRPLIGETVDSLRRALERAKVTPGAIAKVLLVGGSSRIPLVGQMVSAELGRPVAVDADPKNAVALGAARWAERGLADSGSAPPAAAPPATAPGPGPETPSVPSGPAGLAAAAGVAAVVPPPPQAASPQPVVAPPQARPPQSAPPQAPPPGAPGQEPPPGAPPQAPPPHRPIQPMPAGGQPPLRREEHKRRGLLMTLVGVVVVAGTAAIAFVFLSGSSGADSTEVFREPVGSVGVDPFTADIVIDDGVLVGLNPEIGSDSGLALPPLDLPSGAGVVTIDASAPGLYGGTNAVAICDTDQLEAFLAENADKAQAWANVHDIAVSEIAGFIDGLTEVILKADTRVTNHGFTDGEANAINSVLQAGNAVLVDRFGVPRVRCKCGNPLLEPEPLTGEIAFRGEPWTGFDIDDTVVVVAAAAPIDDFTVTDVQTGAVVSKPSGATNVVGSATPSPGPTPTLGLVLEFPTPSDDPDPTPTAAPDPTPEPPPTPTPVPEPTPLPEPIDITALGGVVASSQFDSSFGPGLAIDGDLTTSWFSAGSQVDGIESTYQWTANGPVFIDTIQILSNAGHFNPDFRTNFGFDSVTVLIVDTPVDGNVVFQADFSLAGTPDPDITVPVGVFGQSINLVFSGHESPDCGGFGELFVLGFV